MFQYVMGNDPRPSYVHQTNLTRQTAARAGYDGHPAKHADTTGDGLLYSVLNPLLAEYHEYFASSAPYEQLTLGGISNVLAEQSAWRKAATAGQVSGYIEGSQVTINNSGAAAVTTPLTGVSGVGSSDGGIQAGWTSAPAGASMHGAGGLADRDHGHKDRTCQRPAGGRKRRHDQWRTLHRRTAVHFGTTSATSFEVKSETSISAVSPAGSGTECVTVTTPTGTSTESAGCLFTYVAPPTILTCTVSVTQSTASLCAQVNPNGGEVKECNRIRNDLHMGPLSRVHPRRDRV